MKILITGVAGFIGFHLAKKLIEQGYEVVGIDNIIRGRYAELDEREMEQNISFDDKI